MVNGRCDHGMRLFVVKLTLTPILMWLVTLATRRWGPTFGGVIAGLPLTSGPISIFLFLEQGPDFAVKAAVSSLAAVAGVALFSVGYSRFADRQPIVVCLFSGLACFFLAVLLADSLQLSLAGAFALAICSIVLALVTLSDRLATREEIDYPDWDLPVRILTATTLVVAVTVSASVLGPRFSGLLSPIPVVAWPLCIFVHLHQGSAAANRVLRGIAQGAFGVCLFYAVVTIGLPHFDPALVYIAALGGSVLVSLPWLALNSRDGQ
jgi:hypothetical protein